MGRSINEEVATSRFGQNGVVAIDLSKVGSQIVDLTGGIPGIGRSTMLSRWAANAQEVLIRGSVPAKAITPVPWEIEVVMSYEIEIEILESEWSTDDGFFWQIRQGCFNVGAFERALKKVAAISIAEDFDLPRRLVSLLWYIPLFMEWQVERILENNGDMVAYTKAITIITNEIERLLGVP
jgi:hypothetical protein